MQYRYGNGLLLCAALLSVVPSLSLLQGTKKAINYKVFADLQDVELKKIVDDKVFAQTLMQNTNLDSAFLASVADVEGSFIYKPDLEAAVREDFNYLYDVANLCLFTALIFDKVKTPKKFSPVFTIEGGEKFIKWLLNELMFNYGSFATEEQHKIQEEEKCVVAPLRRDKEKQEPSDLWLGNENFNTFVFCQSDTETSKTKIMEFFPCKTEGKAAANSVPGKPANAQVFALTETQMIAAIEIAVSKKGKAKEFEIEGQTFTLGGIFAICLDRMLSNTLDFKGIKIEDLELITFLKQVQDTIKNDKDFKYGLPVVRYFTKAIFTPLIKK